MAKFAKIYAKTESEAWQKVARVAKRAALHKTESARDVEGPQWAPHMKLYTFLIVEGR